MKKINNPLLNYENKWVALTLDNKKVIASDKDFKKLHHKLEKMKIGKKEAIMHYVLPFGAHYSPWNVQN